MQQAIRYALGLDIGIASVGWCVLGDARIIDLGVRAFDKAETPDKGESLNKARRDARLLRRRLYRRAWRLTRLARLLAHAGLIASVDVLKRPPGKGFPTPNLWQLRVEALDRKLSGEEWARVIYHLCKHRGFHWYSKAEQAKQESEAGAKGGSVKQGLSNTARLMQEKHYRSVAEMVLAEFPDAQRNKAGNYDKALARVLLDEELGKLFEAQRDFGNPHAGAGLEQQIRGHGDQRSGLFWEVKPALSGENLLKMLGHCTFEKQEKRAPKASFTVERHVWLTRLNNLRIVVDGESRPLKPDEHKFALNLPYLQAAEKFSHADLRKKLVREGLLPESFRFLGLAGARKKKDGTDSNPEDDALVRLPAWQELRKALTKAGLEAEWKKISMAALEGQPEALDDIARVLSVYKDDAEIERELRKLNLPGGDRMIQALLPVSFDKFSSLSLKALRKIVPEMEKGLRYDDAVKAAGYAHHSQITRSEGKQRYLPPFYSGRDRSGKMLFRDDLDVPRNPVVLRALNQARKVVNALIREYGSPAEVHIEMARDLSRPLDERRDIEKLQKEYAQRNEQARSELASHLNGARPKGREFEKWLLYREQGGKCAYCIHALDLNQVLDDANYAQVDHVLPYSRSFDDSRNNKVVVHTKCNQDKGNQTPYEYLDGAGDSARWQTFAAWVQGNHAYRLAKRNRLLRKNYGREEQEGFKDRNLNDTRYICKFFKQYVEDNLQLSSDSKRCVVLSGQLTSFLRARWGLTKLREGSDRHHAVDAAVVAACSHAMVKRLSDYARRKELAAVRDGYVDAETGEVIDIAALRKLEGHFPTPFPTFADELCARAGLDRNTGKVLDDTSIEALRESLRWLKDDDGKLRYDEGALNGVRPLFVSRAPQRRNGGAAHKDTIYARQPTSELPNRVTQTLRLADLTLKHFGGEKYDEEKCQLIEPHRNERLYRALHARLLVHGGNADKAFAEPFHKPTHDGKQGPLVRSVTLAIDKLSGIPVRGGIAKNDSMVRVDVFRKKGKFHLVPVYTSHAAARELPNRAAVAHKSEDEWTRIDGSFEFMFSVYPKDLIRIKQRDAEFYGYFAGSDIASANVSLWAHDRNQRVGKDGLFRGIGVKTALSFEKFSVDVLGVVYPAPPETRRGLA
ncbi:MAG: type II CRISPR RNA-guided endonuclease Cas9 [Proteobacteria bacterium]|nr:type II CRISPR RNA-guided endonuclease Cas9 [Pseudomonadota bacterium]